jgi:hypothetical protein
MARNDERKKKIILGDKTTRKANGIKAGEALNLALFPVGPARNG